MEIASNPNETNIFTLLESLKASQQLPEEKCEVLQDQILLIHDLLAQAKQKEYNKISEEKLLESNLRNTKDQTNTILKLSEQLKEAQSKVVEYNDRFRDLKQEIQMLEEERRKTATEFEKSTTMSHESEIESQLRIIVQNTQKEVMSNQSQIDRLKREIDEHQMYIKELLSKMEAAEKIRQETIVISQKETSLPMEVIRISEQLSKKLDSVRRDLETKDDHIDQLKNEHDRLTQIKQNGDTKHQELKNELEQKRLTIIHVESKIEMMNREKELTKHRALVAREERVQIEGRLKAKVAQRIELNESLKRSNKEYDMLTKSITRYESIISTNRGIFPSLNEVKEKLQAELDRMKREIKEYQDERKQNQKEIDYALWNHLQQDNLTEQQQKKIESVMMETSRCQRQLDTSQQQLHSLYNQISKISLDRQAKIREYQRIVRKQEQTGKQVKMKSHILMDTQKRYEELVKQSGELDKLCDAIKTEKNNFLSMIQILKQRRLEISDKQKLLLSEHEILQNEYEQKQIEYTKVEIMFEKSTEAKSSLRTETNRLYIAHRKQKEALEKDEISIKNLQRRLDVLINAMDLSSSNLKRYSLVCQKRSVVLRECNRQIEVLSERIDEYVKMSRENEHKIREYTGHIHDLSLIKKELTSSVKIIRKSISEKNELEGEWVRLDQHLKELMQNEDAIHSMYDQMSKAVESSHSVRFIEGKDATKEEISLMCSTLANKLSEKEEHCRKMMDALSDIEAKQKLLQQELEKRKQMGDVGIIFHLHVKQSSDLDSKLLSLSSELEMYQTLSNKLKTDHSILEKSYNQALISTIIK